MQRRVNVHEAKTNLSRLLERVEHGEEIIIARAGKPVASLVPYRDKRRNRTPGSMKGRLWIAADFDETPSEIAESFHAGDIFPPESGAGS